MSTCGSSIKQEATNVSSAGSIALVMRCSAQCSWDPIGLPRMSKFPSVFCLSFGISGKEMFGVQMRVV